MKDNKIVTQPCDPHAQGVQHNPFSDQNKIFKFRTYPTKDCSTLFIKLK